MFDIMAVKTGTENDLLCTECAQSVYGDIDNDSTSSCLSTAIYAYEITALYNTTCAICAQNLGY